MGKLSYDCEDLCLLFDMQIRTLRRMVSGQIYKLLMVQRQNVVIAAETEYEEGRIPFLPVIPLGQLDIAPQMSMVRNDGNQGVVEIEPSAIQDVVETPALPYYIYDIENGRAMYCSDPLDARGLIMTQARRSLTVTETIALCVHTSVLWRHCVYAVGSRYSSDQVPLLQLRSDDVPVLSYCPSNTTSKRAGTASCLFT
jgi:hypothetical protein